MAELRSLEIFYWTASLGSFRKAADRMNTSQPAVSQRIAALGGDAYFTTGYNLLHTHAGGIRAMLEAWPISPDFQADGRAPVTPFLRELAAATASPLAPARPVRPMRCT